MEVSTSSRYNIKTLHSNFCKGAAKAHWKMNSQKMTCCHLQCAVCVTRCCCAALAEHSTSAPQEELCVTVICKCAGVQGVLQAASLLAARDSLWYTGLLSTKWHLSSSASIHFKALHEYSLMNTPGGPCWQSPLRHRCHHVSSPSTSSHTKARPQFSNTSSMPLEQEIYTIYCYMLYLSCWQPLVSLQHHRTVWVIRDHNDHLVPTPLPWVGLSSAGPGYIDLHPI